MRMYTRWAEQHKYRVEVFDTSYAEEAGLKSATFAIHAPYAYGTLSVEAGTHRLVRISPFDNQGRRQTSFAAVEVVPVLEQTDEIEVPDEDVRVDVYRSGGPGGQSVNTTDSAVRLTHIPTGIVVSCQNEKSQLQNKASAMVVLKAKLLALKKAEEEAQIKELKGDVAGVVGRPDAQLRPQPLPDRQGPADRPRVGQPAGGLRRRARRLPRGRHPLAPRHGQGDSRGLTARPSPDRVLAGTCPPSAGWVHPLGKVPMEPIDPVYGTATLLLIAAGAVALLLVLIMGLKLHAFVSLVLVSLVTAIAVGFEFAEIPDVLLFGFADTIGSVALLVAFGVMLGRLLEVTGGAQVLADTLIGRFGEKRAPFALGVAALIFGFPIFFDAGLVVFLPIILTVARRFGGSLLYYALPAAGGFAAMHAVVPPHPGPVAAAEQINADIGLTLLIGIPIAVRRPGTSAPTWSPSSSRHASTCPWPTWSSAMSTSDHDGRDDAAFGSRPPSFATVLGLLLLPLVLISFDTVLDTLVIAGVLEEGTGWVEFLGLLGQTPVALLITVLAAIFVLGRPNASMARVTTILDQALGPICAIILITGAGGMFGGVLELSGIGAALSSSLSGLGMSLILQAFVIATLLRVAQGSATVALTTTGGLIAGPASEADLGDVQLTLLVVAIAAGATVLSHVNDSGFWLVSRFFGMDEKTTLKTWTVMETTLGVSAFADRRGALGRAVTRSGTWSSWGYRARGRPPPPGPSRGGSGGTSPRATTSTRRPTSPRCRPAGRSTTRTGCRGWSRWPPGPASTTPPAAPP